MFSISVFISMLSIMLPRAAVSANRIIAIVSPESAPIKRMVQEAKDKGTAIDATCGRRTRAVVIMDSGHIVLSAIQSETVAGRLDKDEKEEMGE